ncbi:rhoptry protein ROP16 [Besnoitia besnoiti]|uniref:Rhoptry protein ROP16 n=1 Tax=Besnoitia besnoiti TaxID=94643 RepID=A0A2A9MH04_BESBE|nr:rhoptry protein ROP16 [Besnoitia besnoiti]PFH37808.1 rhoptry protein ROP16 [Besnoitia besnoiti]
MRLARPHTFSPDSNKRWTWPAATTVETPSFSLERSLASGRPPVALPSRDHPSGRSVVLTDFARSSHGFGGAYSDSGTRGYGMEQTTQETLPHGMPPSSARASRIAPEVRLHHPIIPHDITIPSPASVGPTSPRTTTSLNAARMQPVPTQSEYMAIHDLQLSLSPPPPGDRQPAKISQGYVTLEDSLAAFFSNMRIARRHETSPDEIQALHFIAEKLLGSVPDIRALTAAVQEAIREQKREARDTRASELFRTPIEAAVETVLPVGKPVSVQTDGGAQMRLINKGILGSGCFGVVLKVSLEDRRKYAAKMAYGKVERGPGMSRQALQAEIARLKTRIETTVQAELGVRGKLLATGHTPEDLKRFRLCVCTQILRLPTEVSREVVLDSTTVFLSREIMLQPLLGPTMASLVRRHPSFTLQRAVAREVVLAIAGLHELGFAHGDVKMSNILFHDDGSAYLVDIGSAAPLYSRMTNLDSIYARLGSPELARLWQGRATGPVVRAGADAWALGSILFQFTCAGRLHYRISDVEERLLGMHLMSIQLSEFSYHYCPAPDPAVMGIALRFLDTIAERRPSVVPFTRQHAFFGDPSDAISSDFPSWTQRCPLTFMRKPTMKHGKVKRMIFVVNGYKRAYRSFASLLSGGDKFWITRNGSLT